MLFVTLDMQCWPEHVGRALALIGAHVATHRLDAGHCETRVGEDLFGPGRLIVFEQWSSEADFRAHVASPKIVPFIDTLQRLLVEPGLMRMMPAARLLNRVGEQAVDRDELPAPKLPDGAVAVLIYELRHQPDEIEAMRGLQGELHDVLTARPGHLRSCVVADALEPGRIFGITEWRSLEALEATRTDRRAAAVVARLAAHAIGPPRVRVIQAGTIETSELGGDSVRAFGVTS